MKFYVYELRDETGKPFYVGKGSGDRIDTHLRKAQAGCLSHRSCKIRQILASGGQVIKAKVFETDDERAAFAEEMRLIALHGRNNLTNKTDGGDGPSNPTPEVRAKIAAGRKGYKASQATRELQRQRKLGTHRSKETKAKISASQKGKRKPWASLPKSEEYKKMMSIACAGRVNSPETRKKISLSKLGHTVSEETRLKISRSRKGIAPWNKGKKPLESVRTLPMTINSDSIPSTG